MHRVTAAEIANYNADIYLRRKEMIERMKNMMLFLLMQQKENIHFS